jgi:hypothetical protein
MPDYVKYDVKLPNRNLLKGLIGAGWLLIAAAVATLIWSLVKFMDDLSSYANDVEYPRPAYCDGGMPYGFPPREVSFPECRLPEPISVFSAEWLAQHWYYAVVLLVIGIVVATYSYGRFNNYYRRVSQGKIVQRDTSGGGNYPLRWLLLVEGHTLSNELRRDWRGVNAGYWQDAEVGDWVLIKD